MPTTYLTIRGVLPARIFSIILIILVAASGALCGQKLIVPEANSFSGRTYTHRFPYESDMYASCMLRDRLGFIWIGTYNGLYRFDGFSMTKIGSNSGTEKGGFTGKIVSAICEDAKGNIWFGTSGGLNCYDIRSGSFLTYYPDSLDRSSRDNNILEMLIDSGGRVWCVTCGDLFAFSPLSRTFRMYRLPEVESMVKDVPYSRNQGRIIEDGKGNIWFINEWLYLYRKNMDSVYIMKYNGLDSGISSNHPTSLTKDRNGNIWITTLDKGLYLVRDAEKEELERIELIDKSVNQVRMDSISLALADSDGSIWLFGNKLFGRFAPDTRLFTLYSTGPPSGFIGFDRNDNSTSIAFAFQEEPGEILFADRHGMLFRFFKREERLLVYYSPWTNFHAISSEGSVFLSSPSAYVTQILLNPAVVQAIPLVNDARRSVYRQSRLIQDASGKIWYTVNHTQNDGIYIFEKPAGLNNFRPTRFVFPDGVRQASTIFMDRSNNLWFTRFDGKIACINRATGEFRLVKMPEAHTGMEILQEDSKGNIWLSMGWKGIWILRKNSDAFGRFEPGNDEFIRLYMDEGIYDMFIDSRDRVWFGIRDGKCWHYNIEKNTLVQVSPEKSDMLLNGDICLRIKEDSRGKIWMLFLSDGLYWYDPDNGIIKRLDINMPASGNMYLDLFIDSMDRIRVAHLKGYRVIENYGLSSRNIAFDFSVDNFISIELDDGSVLMNNEELLFYITSNIQKNEVPPDLFITSVLTNGREYQRLYKLHVDIREAEKLKIRYSHNNIKIGFTGLSFINPEYNSYRYFLKGIDSDTILTDSRNTVAEYKKLKPGKYDFWFTASNNDGVWNRTGRHLEIVITPPFYRSKLAFGLYIVIASLSGVWIVSIRTRKLRKEKKILEEMVADRTRELEEKNRQIIEMDRIKTKFFSEISHEIRTPLSLISGPIESLIRENDSIEEERKLKWMEMIRRNSRRLLNLVNQLLDISRLDAGKMKVTLSEGDVINCLRILANEYLSLAESRKIGYIIDIPETEYRTIFDRDKTEKILSNLLSNAFKFTPSWGLVTCCITISEGTDPVGLHISVSDTGVGIDPENRERIFDRFYRIEGQWDKDGSGTGIGLSLTREFVHMLHGTVSVRSEPGAGSTFDVVIPLGESHFRKDEYIHIKQKSEDIREMAIQEESNNAKQDHIDSETEIEMEVLVVEDNTDLLNYISENLEERYRVYRASDGNTGLKLAFSRIPDLVITDLIMPDTDGIDLCNRLKNDERTSHIPVIILTARTTADSKIEGLRAGADDYIYKPFEMRELLARIDNLISLREKLRLKYGLLTGLEHHAGKGQTLDDRFMAKLTSVINENLKDFDFDVGALQEKIGMSRVHLFRKVKAITGLSPSMLIRNMRMKKAESMIRSNDGNLTAISLSVGFSNPSYFSKCFREYFGVTPREYSEKIRTSQMKK